MIVMMMMMFKSVNSDSDCQSVVISNALAEIQGNNFDFIVISLWYDLIELNIEHQKIVYNT